MHFPRSLANGRNKGTVKGRKGKVEPPNTEEGGEKREQLSGRRRKRLPLGGKSQWWGKETGEVKEGEERWTPAL